MSNINFLASKVGSVKQRQGEESPSDNQRTVYNDVWTWVIRGVMVGSFCTLFITVSILFLDSNIQIDSAVSSQTVLRRCNVCVLCRQSSIVAWIEWSRGTRKRCQ